MILTECVICSNISPYDFFFSFSNESQYFENECYIKKNQWPITSIITSLKTKSYCEWITAHFNWNVHPKGIFRIFFFFYSFQQQLIEFISLIPWNSSKENFILAFSYLIENDIDQDTWFDEIFVARKLDPYTDWNNVLLIQYLTFFYHRYFDFIWDSEYLFLNVISFYFFLLLLTLERLAFHHLSISTAD